MSKRRAPGIFGNFVFAAVFAVFGCGALSPVHAQQPPTIDADALKLPKATAPAEAAHTPNDGNKEAAPKFTAPSVNLGQFDLKFDAGKTSDVVPRTGFDSGETSNLSKTTGGKPDKVTPDYFGLKLSVPTK